MSSSLYPRPIVHRAGGMLLQATKEFVICGDLQPEDVFFYYTTTSVMFGKWGNQISHYLLRGWMMWNFLISALSVGSSLVLYDGSPLRDPSYLWKLVDELGITIFGTSAKYIDQLSVCGSLALYTLSDWITERISPSGKSQPEHFTTHIFNRISFGTLAV